MTDSPIAVKEGARRKPFDAMPSGADPCSLVAREGRLFVEQRRVARRFQAAEPMGFGSKWRCPAVAADRIWEGFFSDQVGFMPKPIQGLG